MSHEDDRPSILLRPLGLLLLLAVSVPLLAWLPLDVWLQDRLHDPVTGGWLIDRDNVLLRWLFYDGVKLVYVLLLLGIWLGTGLSFRKRAVSRHWRARLLVVALSMTLGPVTVGILKKATDMPCPRQLQRYGGKLPHVTLLGRLSGTAPALDARCYPAGHASGGFALISLLFLFRGRRARRRVVVAALTLGWLTGGYKMGIGDHFFSHTWVSMLWVSLLTLLIARVVCAWRRQSLSGFMAGEDLAPRPASG
jgi:membrane-associated PAP2 superfamily phosphatase